MRFLDLLSDLVVAVLFSAYLLGFAFILTSGRF